MTRHCTEEVSGIPLPPVGIDVVLPPPPGLVVRHLAPPVLPLLFPPRIILPLAYEVKGEDLDESPLGDVPPSRTPGSRGPSSCCRSSGCAPSSAPGAGPSADSSSVLRREIVGRHFVDPM